MKSFTTCLSFGSQYFTSKSFNLGKSFTLGTIAALSTLSAPAIAAITTDAVGVTAPGGTVQIGRHLWVSDHLQGFCRLDPALTVAATRSINAASCVTNALSPGQPSYDASRRYVYVPDNSSKSQGVWRFRFNPTTNRMWTGAAPVGSDRPFRLGGIMSGKNVRVSGSVLNSTGSILYVSALKTGRIFRVDNPHSTSPVISARGRSSDGGGVASHCGSPLDLSSSLV
ncbi:MAG: hypothetical protein VKJ24_22010 [Synechococcales bacterium]|nr:hypothetical protein [Synechococcales bacterium]